MLRLLMAVILLAPVTAAHGSEAHRRIVPELCEAEQRPAITSLAVPERVRASARSGDPGGRADRRRRRSTMAGWLLVVAAAAAASAVAIAASR